MMAALSANFSLPAAKPPAQKIGVAGFDAKLFGADSAPQLPPAPTVAQLCERPFAPEMLRFYLTKRQAEQIHSAASVEGEVWRYTWGGRTRDVKLPLPKDGQEAEQKAVMTIADTEGLDEVPIRTYIAQVVSANWHDFLRGVAEAQQPRPQPGIPAQLLNMLEQQAVLQEPCYMAPLSSGKNAAIAAAQEPECPHSGTPCTQKISRMRGGEWRDFCGKPPTETEFQCPAEEKAPPVAGERPAPGFAKEDRRLCGAADFLCEAADLMIQRGKEYDRITGAVDDAPEPEERSIARTVAAFNAIHHTHLTAAQGWHFMALLKQVRLFTAPTFHRDSAADGVAYMALLAEEKSMEP